VLSLLRIRNLALVADLTLELPGGLIAITGETGAGKSILIGALNLVLGDRADRTLIRGGADSCAVEAVFEPPSHARLRAVLEAHGLEAGDAQPLLLKRTFTAAGANRQYVNGSPALLQALAALGEWLVDVHGPHDHQSLLHSARQLAILDAFGNHARELVACADALRGLAALEARKASLIVDEHTYAQQLDLLRFQSREIASARLQPGEEEEVAAKHRRADNAARLLQLGQAALGVLRDDEISLATQAAAAHRLLQELRRVDPGAEPLLTAHAQLTAALAELRTELQRYLDRVEVDPAQLAALEERLNTIQTLKRKYGGTVPEILRFGAQAQQRLEQLEQREAELARLYAQIQQGTDDLWRVCLDLSAKRRRLIPRLAAAVSRELADLGFRQSRFDIALESLDRNPPAGELSTASTLRPSACGIDTIEFQFAPNPGEPQRPLRAIASSGEMARVMLALKTVLAAHDEIPVLVFDEVDANIGGETANVVGVKLRQLAQRRQVLCITHLPQIAAAATAHFFVQKETRSGRTISTIQRLEGNDRISELARMLGGQSQAARRHAAALLQGER
jgi:DNA repair protein RecN (Recombination protein N)